MKIDQVLLHAPSLEIGPLGHSVNRGRERFTTDGPVRVEWLDNGWVAIMDKRDETAKIVAPHRVREILIRREVLEALLAEPDNVSGAHRAAIEAGVVVEVPEAVDVKPNVAPTRRRNTGT